MMNTFQTETEVIPTTQQNALFFKLYLLISCQLNMQLICDLNHCSKEKFSCNVRNSTTDCTYIIIKVF